MKIPEEYYCPILQTIMSYPIRVQIDEKRCNYYEQSAWDMLPVYYDRENRRPYKLDPLTRAKIYDESKVDHFLRYTIEQEVPFCNRSDLPAGKNRLRVIWNYYNRPEKTKKIIDLVYYPNIDFQKLQQAIDDFSDSDYDSE